jgi:REP-associated tyrosine transposase
VARIARVVVPGLPHHVTQRGNRREPIFFQAADYRLYRRLVGAAARRAGAEIWAYCLMPNHVHLIVTPADADGLRATFADAHRRYTGAINARFRWTGHLFQGRFGAVVMDEAHLIAAVRYLALNPVAAGLVGRAEDWPWSSAAAHLAGRDDGVAVVAPVLARIPDFAGLLAVAEDAAAVARLGSANSNVGSAAPSPRANRARSPAMRSTATRRQRRRCRRLNKLSP